MLRFTQPTMSQYVFIIIALPLNKTMCPGVAQLSLGSHNTHESACLSNTSSCVSKPDSARTSTHTAEGKSSSGGSDGSGVESMLDCSDRSPKDSGNISGDGLRVRFAFISIDAAVVGDGSIDGEATGVVAAGVVAAGVVAAGVVAAGAVAAGVVAGRVVAGGAVSAGDPCSVGIPVGLGSFRASQPCGTQTSCDPGLNLLHANPGSQSSLEVQASDVSISVEEHNPNEHISPSTQSASDLQSGFPQNEVLHIPSSPQSESLSHTCWQAPRLSSSVKGTHVSGNVQSSSDSQKKPFSSHMPSESNADFEQS
ncbi:hypothetical protein FGB62_86g013 [Gracilaria domingensis]|nr:hypothetical protein FGB62_86g013 [Gracilaria domingensis]